MERTRRHGSFLAEHRTWCNMRYRCNNERAANWINYGGEGVAICKRWDSFEAFYADMGPRPGPGYSIDRIDPFGNYEPSNCRWATAKEQARNTRARNGGKSNGWTCRGPNRDRISGI